MYIKKTYITGNFIEIEKITTSRCKGKNVKRMPRMNPTPENMKKVNERHAFKKLRRILNSNFDGDSYHVVATYRPECRPESVEKAKKDMAKFWRQLKKFDKNVKYVAVAEHTQKGTIHFHMVIRVAASVKEIQSCWPHGFLNFRPLEENGDYEKLAWYLLKESKQTYNDINLRVFGKRWCESKNLLHPEPKIEKIKADSWREDPSCPKDYFVLSDSVEIGISEVTGWPYQHYRCQKLGKEPDRLREGARC